MYAHSLKNNIHYYKMVIIDPMCYGAMAWAGISFY